MSCGEVHSQARALVEQGYAATVVAAALMISRSSLYYRKKPEAAEQIASGMNKSFRPAEKNQLTAIDV